MFVTHGNGTSRPFHRICSVLPSLSLSSSPSLYPQPPPPVADVGMGRKKRASDVETTPELSFVQGGVLNTIIVKGAEEMQQIAVDTTAFLEDKRVVRSTNMDQVTFSQNAIFKVTLDFAEAMPCIPETAVRESTDWMLLSCTGNHAHYSTVDQRLILQQCKASLQSNIPELEFPVYLVLRFDDDEWVVERIIR
ncbi:hypothetical_protein_-_conserved [Leishmania major strain Friedlin]|nr:hypothetical_protein_-_conserved [Leishmania major strain Friedlin]